MRLILFTDSGGIQQLSKHIQREDSVMVVVASIRSHEHHIVEELCRKHDWLFSIQPKKQSDEYNDFVDKVTHFAPDLLIINSYSMMLHPDVLCLPKVGSFNFHGGVLPEYRGCNPVQWSIVNNERYVGATLHLVTASIDQGPVIGLVKSRVKRKDTWLTLIERVKQHIAFLMEQHMLSMRQGNYQAQEQEEQSAHYHSRRYPEDSEFSLDEPVITIFNKVRASLPPILPAHFWHKGQKHSFPEVISLQQALELKLTYQGDITLGDGLHITKSATAFERCYIVQFKLVSEGKTITLYLVKNKLFSKDSFDLCDTKLCLLAEFIRREFCVFVQPKIFR